MQHALAARFVAIVAVLALILLSFQSQAQYAYSYVPQPEPLAAATDPETGKAAANATKLVHGVIQNERGVLPGATVWLRGSRTVAVTNAEGEFELHVPADAQTVKLVCSYVGLQEEVLTLTPVQALGSIYLLQTKQVAKK